MASFVTRCASAARQTKTALTTVHLSRCQRWSSSTNEDANERRPEPGQSENMTDIGTRNIFSEEHDIFRRTVRKFMEEEVVPNQMRYESQGYVDKELWRLAGATGLFGTTISTDYGGAGADYKYNAIVDEEKFYANDVDTNGWTVHSGIVSP